MCQGERERGDEKVEMILQTSYYLFLVFLYCHVPQCSVFSPDYINRIYFFLCLIQGKNICQQFYFQLRSRIPCPTYFGSKTASGFNLRGLYYQKRMFSECLPVTYNPLQAVHACSACSVVLMKDYSLVFSIKHGVSRWRKREGENFVGLQS